MVPRTFKTRLQDIQEWVVVFTGLFSFVVVASILDESAAVVGDEAPLFA